MERCSILEMLLGALTSASSPFCLLKTRGHVKDRGNDWAAAGQHFYLIIRILINTLLREYRKIIISSAVCFQTAWSHDLKKASLIPLAVLFPVLPGMLLSFATRAHCWLTLSLSTKSPHVLFCRAAFQAACPQRILVCVVILTQVQDFALPFPELQEVHICHFFIWTPCHWSKPYEHGSSANFQYTLMYSYLACIAAVCLWGCYGRYCLMSY